MSKRKPLKKTLHVEGEVWSYKIGAAGVQIRTPDNKKTDYVGFSKLMPDEGEVERLFSSRKFQVRPSDVKEYIKATDGLTHNPIFMVKKKASEPKSVGEMYSDAYDYADRLNYEAYLRNRRPSMNVSVEMIP